VSSIQLSWREVILSQLDEQTLVKSAQNGNAQAVGDLYDRYQARMYRYVRSRVYNHQLAQDITGEIFTRMVTSLDQYTDAGYPFTAWLYRIARNLIIDHQRKEDRYMTVPFEQVHHLTTTANDPSAIVEKQLSLERLHLALAAIDETQREVIRLRFLAGLSLQEVADTLDKTVGAIKAQQYRGLLALRVALKQ
jgi:RNA polymerase sigma-70 factor, ECF subfamily